MYIYIYIYKYLFIYLCISNISLAGPLVDLLPPDGALAFLRGLPGTADALAPPVSDDHERVPRVEVPYS